jgi:transposase
MKTSAFVQPSVASDSAILYVALELSKSKWLVGLHVAGSDKMSEHSVAGGEWRELLTLIEKKRGEAMAACGKPVRVVSCFEAGFDGFWLHWMLLSHGVESRVLDAASIPVNRRMRRAKSDRIDLKTLMRILMALERGEERVCQVVHAPTVEEEDRRRGSREREQLIKERVRHSNRIGGLLMTHGVRGFQPRSKDWRKRLDALRRPDGLSLPPACKAEITRECERLHLLLAQIAQVETEQRAALKATAPPDTPEGRIRMLCRFRGIGLASATPLEHEVFFRDFKNRREVGGYVGLGGSPWQSGDVNRDQGISKAGNRRARVMAIELAWLWLQHQPGSALSLWFEKKTGGAKGRVRRIAVAALARKSDRAVLLVSLMVALWRFVTTGVVPEGAVLKA